MKHLAIITTHPIQYNAPWFRLLAERGHIAIKVFYTWSQVQNEEKFDPGFGKTIEWDIPLLEGYDYTFVKNTSKSPGSKTYRGIQNPSLIQEIVAWGADAVLVFGWKFKSHLQAIRYFHNKIPVLFRGDSTFLNRNHGIKNHLRKLALKRVFKSVDYALYVGKHNKEYFEAAGLNKAQLLHVPHAIDISRFNNGVETKKEGEIYRGRLGISNNKLVFLFAGKFEDVKDPILFLDVASEISDQDVHFVFAGNGPMERDLKSRKASNIHFMDFQNQKHMPGLYAMSNVYVLPSKNETWGLAVNEAMACGRPVLVSDKCGCAADLVEEGKTGFVFRSGDADDLKGKIRWCIQHKDELKQMGENAHEKIQDWSFEKIVTAIENLVNSFEE
ncbi:MAG: glycosyltransferase family 4 protein [Chitinophagaceae bacterium]|nr:glycosyltransferase family 4 protein [Chitinophagaceae bacterium]